MDHPMCGSINPGAVVVTVKTNGGARLDPG